MWTHFENVAELCHRGDHRRPRPCRGNVSPVVELVARLRGCRLRPHPLPPGRADQRGLPTSGATSSSTCSADLTRQCGGSGEQLGAGEIRQALLIRADLEIHRVVPAATTRRPPGSWSGVDREITDDRIASCPTPAVSSRSARRATRRARRTAARCSATIPGPLDRLVHRCRDRMWTWPMHRLPRPPLPWKTSTTEASGALRSARPRSRRRAPRDRVPDAAT